MISIFMGGSGLLFCGQSVAHLPRKSHYPSGCSYNKLKCVEHLRKLTKMMYLCNRLDVIRVGDSLRSFPKAMGRPLFMYKPQ